MDVDDRMIAMVRDMLKAAALHGHKYAIDAVLAAVAGREAAQGAEATVFTSDTDDMAQLLAGHSVRVEKVCPDAARTSARLHAEGRLLKRVSQVRILPGAPVQK
ncbi:hypothetical protein [Streptomyces sp. ME18-1-4]|uniref:hypothetical protein n=1 Tax=Streptomyces sp. ME18-1-4 TaxID=3028685 RepID=UPI0029A267A9|nr:hypothetical protein [Streptomyces sp. ME18-1-4]MDX3241466.1 hypothetical protein [Streptomyces sp. ME18-1-4]